MNNRLIIKKCICLSYRKNLLPSAESYDIETTVNKALSTIKVNDVALGLNTEKELLDGLTGIIRSLLNQSYDNHYDLKDILSDILAVCGDDNETYYEAIADILSKDSTQESITLQIVMDLKELTNDHGMDDLQRILYTAVETVSRRRATITDPNLFLTEVLGELEEINLGSATEDPASIARIDFSKDRELIVDAFRKTKEICDGGKVWRLGWKLLNSMYHGGLRPGNFVYINALQHNYKTGFSLSIFKQLAVYNDPATFQKDPTKVPTLKRITYEDPMSSNLQFLFQNIMFNKTGRLVDVAEYTEEEMTDVALSALETTGWNIILEQKDPDKTTYRDIINGVLEDEADGAEIHALCLDYLPMISTRGCDREGPMGTDYVSLFRKMRAFGASKDILIVTPGQLNAESKGLVANGVSDRSFLETIKGRGMHANSKQLSNEVDINMYIHIIKVGNEFYLHVLSDKHRFPIVTPDTKRAGYLPFPTNGMPISDDLLLKKSIHLRRLPSINDFEGGVGDSTGGDGW